MDHYYTSEPSVKHETRVVEVHARATALELKTDSGVFSKKGLDYGTRLLIETVRLPEAGTIVDLGCGYGPVAGVLLRVYPKTRWVLLDVNRRAVQLAQANLGGFEQRCETHVSDGFAAVPALVADAVLLNPPIRAGKAVVYRLFAEARDHLKPGGELWIVIQKKQGAASARSTLEALFSRVELCEKSGGYHVYRSVTSF
ncbi:class I SAM-dependent methyltransferase [Alicyclobacillus sp. SO9]|uniref:class I SAM-dependent methyltransferase n=1 Tax=Alicyclobacillus sp. SO9 TaxID=2665646 RepID=UPI0018E8978A|nr:methyltransferase [Alicyclobacillus sp. SO9]QQE78540.1 class I SAM-dependent methyltransferase [Alicyclobacillus sp. SO9]